MDLGPSGRRAVVLGASRGLRLATATALAAEGASVILCGRNEARLADAVQRLKAIGGTAAYRLVDLVVNKSDGPPPGPISAVAAAAWQSVVQGLVASVFAVTAAVLPMSNALRASIIGWAKTLASKVAAAGITVNSVAPGRIHTERVDELDQAAATRSQTSVAEVAAASRTTIPAGRHGTPQEVADVVAFLASARASYVTGGILRVDGGMIRGI